MKRAVVTCLWLANASVLMAQATLGGAAVSGTARDTSGGALPGAVATLTETARGLSREAVTN